MSSNLSWPARCFILLIEIDNRRLFREIWCDLTSINSVKEAAQFALEKLKKEIDFENNVSVELSNYEFGFANKLILPRLHKGGSLNCYTVVQDFNLMGTALWAEDNSTDIENVFLVLKEIGQTETQSDDISDEASDAISDGTSDALSNGTSDAISNGTSDVEQIIDSNGICEALSNGTNETVDNTESSLVKKVISTHDKFLDVVVVLKYGPQRASIESVGNRRYSPY
eukprot:105428_1